MLNVLYFIRRPAQVGCRPAQSVQGLGDRLAGAWITISEPVTASKTRSLRVWLTPTGELSTCMFANVPQANLSREINMQFFIFKDATCKIYTGFIY